MNGGEGEEEERGIEGEGWEKGKEEGRERKEEWRGGEERKR